jgi:predicted DNA-binding transcriptional regulator AlpA
MMKDDPLNDSNETANQLRIAPETLAVWRCTKRYDLPWVKVGRRVFYRQSDIEAFIAKRTVSLEGNHA